MAIITTPEEIPATAGNIPALKELHLLESAGVLDVSKLVPSL